MLDIDQFRQYVLSPALSQLQMYSKDAEELLVFTCATESDGGTLLHQINGPAMGIFQCEPNTHNDIWRNFIFNRSDIIAKLTMNFDVPRIPDLSRLVCDLKYATAICRIHYFRVKDKIPAAGDIDAIWDYYKLYYNTPKGKAKKDKAIAAYYRFTKTKAPDAEKPR